MLSSSSLVPLLGCTIALILTGGALSGHVVDESGSGWLILAVTLMVVSVGCLLVVVGSGRVGAAHERTAPAPAPAPGTVDRETRHRARFQWMVASSAIASGMVASLSSRLGEAASAGGMAWSTPLVLQTAGTLGVCAYNVIAVVQFRRESAHPTAHEQGRVDQATA